MSAADKWNLLVAAFLTPLFIRAFLGNYGLRILFNKDVEYDERGRVKRPNSIW